MYPAPWHQYPRRPASEKAHFGLGYKIRGHGMGKRRMRRPFGAFQLLFRRQDS
jgi:hypothetical protein